MAKQGLNGSEMVDLNQPNQVWLEFEYQAQSKVARRNALENDD